ncbi:DUF1351 domain-containing protein [Aliarcobacter butzleri]|uniref:DUF1351 domain-containing protein n=1 Tax=Aliarcobacter butzleri TaxID=28197 RepID=UPI0021B50BB0|nr:DUF1351 domain-containing protein [Aliarcobacter butzleri]MCT7637038.1 DUF1351 domain-containing protein [Aliarcobacter butzleri]
MSANEVIEINKIKLDGALTILNLNANMDQLENAVIKELEKPEYNSIVTMTNFKDMKESSLFLGKVAKQISDFRIAKVKEETTDIKLFEDSLKKFTNMFKSKQDEIKQGLDVFEEETRKQVKAVCIAYFDDYSLEVGLSDEFKNVNLEDMTQTGFMTASGSISKKGKEEVEKRVQVQLNLQNKVENRLMMLENQCLKAGIEPLTEQHIQGFILADDDTYMRNLNMLIESELKRAEQIKAKQEQELRQKIEAETSAKNALVEEERTPFDEPVQEVKEEIKEEVKTIPNPYYIPNDEKVMKTLSCTIRVPKDATDEQVINAVIRMIKDDKFPLENIKVM